MFCLDVGHRGTIGDVWGMPNEVRRFEDPKLAWLSFAYWIYTETWGPVTKVGAISEHGWNNVIRPTKDLVDADGNFGKGIGRRSRMDGGREYVSEDTIINFLKRLLRLAIFA